MTLIRSSLAALLLLTLSASAEWKRVESVQPEAVKGNATYSGLLRRCEQMTADGYMKMNPQDSPSALPPGWESKRGDVRIVEYHYTVADRAVASGRKEGRVILFNPEPERLAAWIANAVVETSTDQTAYSEARALSLAKLIWEQSGAQFPIVGLVWEDMEGTGHPKAYGFLDGITVLGAPAAFYQRSDRTTAELGPEALMQGLSLRWEGNARAGRYARIASTTREQVAALYETMGAKHPALEGNEFATYVREAYQKAMDSARNELIVAAARALR